MFHSELKGHAKPLQLVGTSVVGGVVVMMHKPTCVIFANATVI